MNAVWRAPETEVATTHAVEFRGTGREYFRIFVVNAVLTLVTLGLFGPWAKVRTRRYFHGKTLLAGHPFDYDGAPWRILAGRAMVAALAVAGFLCWLKGPWAVVFWLAAAGAAMPWLILSALRFHAHNTSWRGVRFDFRADYREAVLAGLVWPLAGLFTLVLVPPARRAWDRFRIDHLSFGGRAFATQYSLLRMFTIFATGFVLVVGVLVAMIVATTAMVLVQTRMPDFATAHFIPIDPDDFSNLFLLSFVLGASFMGTFVAQMAANLTLNNTVLEGGHRLVSRASPLRVAWIVLTNLALTAATLGIFWPFARVRLARYRMSRYALVAGGDLDALTAELLKAQQPLRAERWEIGL